MVSVSGITIMFVYNLDGGGNQVLDINHGFKWVVSPVVVG
jgi:hypothetical protein